jgi:hypothetical protein
VRNREGRSAAPKTAASFLPSCFSVSFEGSKYFCVVASDSWPSHSCTVRTSIPARSQRVAAVSLKRWRCHSVSSSPVLFATALQRSCRKLGLEKRPGRRTEGKTKGHFSVRECFFRISASSLENGTVRPSQSFGKNAYCGFARTWTRLWARVEVRPVERLELSPAESCCEH